jgi:hypothetical protein
VSSGDSSVARGKQEVAMGLARDSHTAAPWDSTKKTMPLCKEPPGFAGFSGKYKTTLVFADLRFQQVQKVVKYFSGLFYI